MRKWIFILGASLILTGCTRSITLRNDNNAARAEVIGNLEYSKKKPIYIDEGVKAVIQDINNLREKYEDYIDERGFNFLYIDMYSDDYRDAKGVSFNNRNFHSDGYFYDLVEILDGSIAKGLKDYVLSMENKDLGYRDDASMKAIIEKIGRTIVYVEDRREKNNYISININFLDIEDDYYGEIFNQISDEKYILNNMIIGDKLNLIDFVNYNQLNNNYHVEEIKTRYNMFFKDKDIEKVNILMQGKIGAKFTSDDIDVFINLLNSLDLKEEEKDLLMEECKNTFERKINSKKVSLDNYNIYINDKKGDSSSGYNLDMVYFSIERR